MTEARFDREFPDLREAMDDGDLDAIDAGLGVWRVTVLPEMSTRRATSVLALSFPKDAANLGCLPGAPRSAFVVFGPGENLEVWTAASWRTRTHDVWGRYWRLPGEPGPEGQREDH